MQRSEPKCGRPAQRDGIVFDDADHSGATFHTGPNFGCIHWIEAV